MDDTKLNILVVSASLYLAGHPITEVLKADWSKPKAQDDLSRFESIGFQVDPTDESTTLRNLRQKLQEKNWDGVLVGWCLRGHVEFTVLFERIVGILVDQAKVQPDMNIMFSSGPDNLVETTVRNFPKSR
ncbi:hypothetical protein B0I35DRAFT_439778 [Stachybotrys elegans]|uniref:Uncharacterized protein n=1 Tax=Stachybotrys elegans TaxID=80388 RepID=A0A8K0SKI5_9HYPO|nr:hypothetical protein B0I35DRAFT_439778 [Stachybotrys elegans]